MIWLKVSNKGYSLLEMAFVLLICSILTALIIPLVSIQQRNAVCKSFGAEIESVIMGVSSYYRNNNDIPKNIDEIKNEYLGNSFKWWGDYKFEYDKNNDKNRNYYILDLSPSETFKNSMLLNTEVNMDKCLSDNIFWSNLPVEYSGGSYKIKVPLVVNYINMETSGISQRIWEYQELYDFVKNKCIIDDTENPGCEALGHHYDTDNASVSYKIHKDYQRNLPEPMNKFKDYTNPDSNVYNGW
mgnify:CR=1 FL=1